MTRFGKWAAFALCALAGAGGGHAAAAARGTVVSTQIDSQALRDNLVGVAARRDIKVYLPPGYARGTRRYPVIYFIHNYHWSPARLFEENRLQGFAERAVEPGARVYWMYLPVSMRKGLPALFGGSFQ